MAFGGLIGVDCGEGCDGVLVAIYCAMRSESSRKSISSSKAPTIDSVLGSHWQSLSLSTAERVKHCFVMSP